MRQAWSRSWKASTQPRKQRKYHHNAPLHVRRRFLSAHLSDALRASTGRRAVPLRKGDEVKILRGDSRGLTGVVDRVDMKKARVYLDSLKRKKKDGSEVQIPLQPSNLLITRLHLEDKERRARLEKPLNPQEDKPAKPAKPAASKAAAAKAANQQAEAANQQAEAAEQQAPAAKAAAGKGDI
ncbi:MAG: 50S ribosomal protein L24 [Candidatus Aenigmarchaeota archaeon]|nr:50S ribosomal protein L24 [Candidatus Aenigmarchaeota archaeon]